MIVEAFDHGKLSPMAEEAPQEMRGKLESVFARHHGGQAEIIPVLQDIQEELGSIPRPAMVEAAGFLGVPEAVIYGVATFYTQFYLTPQGKHSVKVCRGTACHVRGSKRIMEAASAKLGIQPGETTADLKFSLEQVACFGSCALAPVVVIDGKVYGKMTPKRTEELMGRTK